LERSTPSPARWINPIFNIHNSLGANVMETLTQVVLLGFGAGMFIGFMMFFANWAITSALQILKKA
jgi:hypothetical protein